MSETLTMQVVARIHSDFPTKFGIPRQSGLIESLRALVVFEPEYRDESALRGLEDFSHVWLLWQFSQAVREKWSPTVRPPRLGGNARLGVFATRSPFRPNPIGLSCVELVGVERREGLGTVLVVAGADLMDGTPILDVKPYLPYADCRPQATGGFAAQAAAETLTVDCPPALLEHLPPDRRAGLLAVLAHDPRPPYQRDPARVYAFEFADVRVRFRVAGETLSVIELEPLP